MRTGRAENITDFSKLTATPSKAVYGNNTFTLKYTVVDPEDETITEDKTVTSDTPFTINVTKKLKTFVNVDENGSLGTKNNGELLKTVWAARIEAGLDEAKIIASRRK